MEDMDEHLDPAIVVARFEDPNEGWIAAGALRADGLPVHFDGWGGGRAFFDMTMRKTCGGFPMYAPRSAANQVLDRLRELDPSTPEAVAWISHPKALSSVPYTLMCLLLAWLCTPLGYAVEYARKNPTAFNWIGPGVTILIFAVFGISMWGISRFLN